MVGELSNKVMVFSDFDETLARGHYFGILFGENAEKVSGLLDVATKGSGREVNFKPVLDLVEKNRGMLPSRFESNKEKVDNAVSTVFNALEATHGYKSKELMDLVSGKSKKDIVFSVATRNNEQVVRSFIECCEKKEKAKSGSFNEKTIVSADFAEEVLIRNQIPKESAKQFSDTKAPGKVPLGKLAHVLDSIGKTVKNDGRYPASVLLVDDEPFNIDTLQDEVKIILGSERDIKEINNIGNDKLGKQEAINLRNTGRQLIENLGLDISILKKMEFRTHKVPKAKEMESQKDGKWSKDISKIVNEMVKSASKAVKASKASNIKDVNQEPMYMNIGEAQKMKEEHIYVNLEELKKTESRNKGSEGKQISFLGSILESIKSAISGLVSQISNLFSSIASIFSEKVNSPDVLDSRGSLGEGAEHLAAQNKGKDKAATRVKVNQKENEPENAKPKSEQSKSVVNKKGNARKMDESKFELPKAAANGAVSKNVGSKIHTGDAKDAMRDTLHHSQNKELSTYLEKVIEEAKNSASSTSIPPKPSQAKGSSGHSR